MYRLSYRNCVTKFLAFLLFLCARQRKDQCLRPPFAKDVAKCGLFCFARLSGSVHQFLGQMIAESVQNFLDLCLHVTQCFDYLLSHHNGIVWPSVTAFTSASISASVSSCASMYTSPSVLPRNTASASQSVLANLAGSASASTPSNVAPSVLLCDMSRVSDICLLVRQPLNHSLCLQVSRFAPVVACR